MEADIVEVDIVEVDKAEVDKAEVEVDVDAVRVMTVPDPPRLRLARLRS